MQQPLFKVFTDGANVVAHDIAAQLHVIGFCLEELEKTLNPESQRFFLQVKEAISLINLEVADFRSYLKDLNSQESDVEIKVIFEKVSRILNLFQGKILRKIDITWGQPPLGTIPADKVVETTYAIYSFVLSGIQELKNQSLKVDSIFKDGVFSITLNEQWKSEWWLKTPSAKNENHTLKGMQSKAYGDEMVRVTEAIISIGEKGIMGRIPVSLKLKI